MMRSECVKRARSKPKPGWKVKLKRLALAALISFSLVIFTSIGYFIWDVYDYHPDPAERQQALDANWAQFSEQNNLSDEAYQKFELTLCPFAGEKTWSGIVSPEEAGMICGMVSVPLWHEDPSRGEIKIPVGIWPALEPLTVPDPLFITQGGPGGSTLDQYPSLFYFSWVAGDRDVVFIDQRGTRYAEPSLECPEEREVWVEPPEGSSEDLDEYAPLRECRARLEESGIDLGAFTSPQIARDFEVVRDLFGYKRINFYGVSYGSHIGQYLAAFYPESLRSLILDGVAPIPLDYLNRSITTHSRILEKLEASCSQDTACMQEYPDLIRRLKDTIDQLDGNPRMVTLNDPYSTDKIVDEIDGVALYHLVLSAFYMDHGYAVVPYLINQAASNRFDFFESLGEMIAFEQVNASGLYFSVICAEHDPLVDLVVKAGTRIPNMHLLEQDDQEDARKECAIWGVKPSHNQLDAMPQSEVPTLLMSGNFDPVTPPEYGALAAQSFRYGQHVIDPIGSHGVAFSDYCTKVIVDDFLKGPYAELDTACLEYPMRRSAAVPPDAVSTPFISNIFSSDLVLPSLVAIPGFMLLLMSARGLLRAIDNLWQRFRKTLPKRTQFEKQSRRLFELATWVFWISFIGFGIGLYIIIYRMSGIPAYFYALAMPGWSRSVLFIPLLLAVILPVIIVSTIYRWRFSRTKQEKIYLGVQSGFTISCIAYLAWLELLSAWVG